MGKEGWGVPTGAPSTDPLWLRARKRNDFQRMFLRAETQIQDKRQSFIDAGESFCRKCKSAAKCKKTGGLPSITDKCEIIRYIKRNGYPQKSVHEIFVRLLKAKTKKGHNCSQWFLKSTAR